MGVSRKWFSSSGSGPHEKAGGQVTAAILSRALIDAQLLLMIAAERGIQLDPRIIRTILTTEDAFEKNLITPELASSFWLAYEALSRALSPISIDSIRATHDLDRLKPGLIGSLKGRSSGPFTKKSVFHYKLLALVTLVSLIILQIFWSVGNNLVTDIKGQTDRIASMQAQLLALDKPAGGSGAPTSTQAERQQLREQISSLKNWRDAEILELKGWNRMWGRILLIDRTRMDRSGYGTLSDEAQIHNHYVSAQYMLHAISAYLLPVLYGLLGASFYVLRQLPKDIETLTFSLNSHIEYSLRIAQGPLAGIMAGYFFTNAPAELHSLTPHASSLSSLNDTATSLVDFSPLAIAFLAGYSVELIFYVIERIISAVTNAPTTTATPPAAAASASIRKAEALPPDSKESVASGNKS